MSDDKAAEQEIGELSYEQARDRLQAVLQRLQEPSASLEDSLALWEEGKALADRCETILQTAMERFQTDPADAEEA